MLPLDFPQPPPIWRPVHYLGSKLRLVDTIRARISELDPDGGKVCDLFAGSGTVSLALSSDRSVIAADIQEYSRVLCSALLQPVYLDNAAVARVSEAVSDRVRELTWCVEPLLEYEERALEAAVREPSLLCDVVEHGLLTSNHTASGVLGKSLTETRTRIEKHPARFLATRYFGGVYFAYRQSLFLDCVLDYIDRMPHGERDTYLAALISTASAVVNSVGKQFAQPMRPRRRDGSIKRHLISQMCRDRCIDAGKSFFGWLARYKELPRGGRHRTIRGDYRDVLAGLERVSVIYADPPYTRDHYSRFYHVLETLCLGDRPDISTTAIRGNGRQSQSRGLYRTDRHQSPFCIKSQAPGAFNELFRGARKIGAPILLSYSPYVKDGHPRLMTVEAIVGLAREHYRAVEVETASAVTHSKFNKTELHLDASPNAEVFITCRL